MHQKMAKENSQLNVFTTRVRQLILQYKELRSQNDDLKLSLAIRDEEIENLKSELDKARNDYKALKIARMIEVTDGDVDDAKKKVAKLIRDVNQCITLLSGKETE